MRVELGRWGKGRHYAEVPDARQGPEGPEESSLAIAHKLQLFLDMRDFKT